MLFWLGAGLVIASCGGAERDASPPDPPAAPDSDPATATRTNDETPTPQVGSTRADSLCLAVVHGCGCAYVCGLGRLRADAHYDVVHDFQDSRVDEMARERRCFDARGHAYPEDGAPADATRCIDVFYDLTPCGGECIPTTDYLDCVLVDDRCAPRRATP